MNKETLTSLSALERRATFSLASIYGLRMFGLFIVFPVFALYAQGLEGATPQMIGLAVGVYGLTQALFQIPFGMASDRFGRKPVIALGLLIFAAGSVVAAMSETMLGVILGRALQGSGAVAAAVMALTADLTREENRVKAMAIIGMSIGMSFAVSLVAGPIINTWFGVAGMFWLTAVLALGGLLVLWKAVPDVHTQRFHRDAQSVPAQFKQVLANKELLRLDFGIFILHMVLTALFVVFPLVLVNKVGVAAADHWKIYLPVMVGAMLLMVPFIIVAEAKRRMKQVMALAVTVMAVAHLSLSGMDDSLFVVVFGLFAYFLAFNIMEAILPSMIAKAAPPDMKGTAMGVYSTSQFAGAFVGGVVAGYIHDNYNIEAVFGFCSIALFVWVGALVTMKNPKYLSTSMVRVGPVDAKQARHLVTEMTKIRGVAECVVIPEDEVAYLKIDSKAIDREALMKFSVQSGA